VILELGDGREFHLPDEMEDEYARQLKRFILGAEERARAAEAEVAALREEMATWRQAAGSARQQTLAEDTTARAMHTEMLASAIRELQTAMLAALARVERAALADRQMVMDEFGEYTRSKAMK
jgi:hypothetical protein